MAHDSQANGGGKQGASLSDSLDRMLTGAESAVEGLLGPKVLVISSMDTGQARAWWRREVQGRLKGRMREVGVQIVCATLERVLGEGVVTQLLRDVAGVIVVVDPGEPEAAVRRATGMLIEQGAPTAVCLPGGQDVHRWERLGEVLEKCGAAVSSAEDGAHLAGVVGGLMGRQAAVAEMEIELRTRRAAQQQVHSWVSKVDSELLLAAKLQREMVRCEGGTMPGLQIATIYRPAWYVSGDVYRFTRLDEEHAGFLIADAMGHGLGAAMYGMIVANAMVMKEMIPPAELKPGMRGYRILEPSSVVARMNELLQSDDPDVTRFVTAACGVINAKTGRVVMTSAGHPAGLIVPKGGGAAERLESTGPVIGVFDDTDFGQLEAQVPQGGTLCLYTDGFEAMVGEGVAQSYLEEVIACRDGDVEAIAADIERHIDARPGSLTPSDDVTVMLIKRH